ncbi:hypothetical protein HDV03_003559 [Kappamyces sp. JEL0829]|nr:hypothetical protein HDV03_003559 [Kappamyces sp. JEL0829]
MTEVQRRVLTQELGCDLLVRAKTGTGKTLAFIVRAVETVLHEDPLYFERKTKTPIVVISPTRELAFQIAKEAQKLVRHHRLQVETAVGGTGKRESLSRINEACDILVGTPGRLLDLLSSVPSVQEKCQALKVLVFDEADLLLDMGFRNSMESIVALLPKHRTTFLFSATVSKQIEQIAKLTLRKGYKYIDCIPHNQIETHMKIKQSYCIVPLKEQLYLLQDIIAKHKKANALSKIIVFATSTSQVSSLAKVLNAIPGIDTMSLHSRMTQPERSRVSDQFRRSRCSVLLTTDVSARGVDYPGVTLVLQFGLPSNRDQYIHRIGRTGRANNDGEAILILSPYEKNYLELVKDIPIRQELRYNSSYNAQDKAIAELIATTVAKIEASERKEAAISYLTFHLNKLNVSNIRKDTAIDLAKEYAVSVLGLDRFPTIQLDFAKKLGIANETNLDFNHREAPAQARLRMRTADSQPSVLLRSKKDNILKAFRRPGAGARVELTTKTLAELESKVEFYTVETKAEAEAEIIAGINLKELKGEASDPAKLSPTKTGLASSTKPASPSKTGDVEMKPVSRSASPSKRQ